jgi:hypothetical protein
MPYRASSGSTITTTDIILATKRRTNTQVTRMLLAVTLSLIICNIPNTLYSVFLKRYDTRNLLKNRICTDVGNHEIKLYKFGFYSSVIQDILSDLPHIVNFFLYCLAGKKFRSIFINEVEHFLRKLHLLKGRPRRITQGATSAFSLDSSLGVRASLTNQGRLSANLPVLHGRKSVDVLYGGRATKTVLSDSTHHHHHLQNLSSKRSQQCPTKHKSTRSHSTIH